MDNMGQYSQAQWAGWAYNGVPNQFPGYAPLHSYATYLPQSMELYSAQHRHLAHPHMSRTTETKPRLSKEEVEALEGEFQKNHKPNSSTKKALAESMRVDNARINNWFQNRRAREKKERNIREYAAKQKLEKEKSTVDSDDASDHDRHSDLVVSSAPFPEPRPLAKTQMRESSMPSDLATPELESETVSNHSFEDIVASSSPEPSEKEFGSTTPASNICDTKIEYFTTGHDGKGSVSESTSDFLSVSETSQSIHGDDLSVSDFGRYPQLVIPTSSGETTPSFSRSSYSESHELASDSIPEYTQYDTSDYDDDQLDVVGDGTHGSAVPIKMPPSMDIASRRNRRPPHLAINASRSYSAGGPRTGFDMGRRGSEVGHAMRRVASATGTVRIAKQSGTPRSPFFDRNPEALFQLNRSPNFSATTGTIAPPTPNTPVVSDVASSCGLSLDEKYQSGLVIHDPTLRTPPTTPGIMENMFTLNSAYDMAISDEPLVTPGMGCFPTDFEMPRMSTNVPEYVANNNCSSQPQTPSYVPQVGPAYYGYSGGNAEYNWSDASMSARSSPGQNARHVHFMNMTPSSFVHVEK